MAIGAFAADPGIWKVAPPPPASWQRDRVADLAARRKALMDQIGDHAVLILYAAEPRNYANDVDWPFRQENDFFYLTGLTQPGATLVLAPGAGKIREMVFIPRPDPAQETWTGHMITAAEVRETSGIHGRLRSQPVQRLSLSTLIPRARSVLATPAEGMGGGRGGRGGSGRCRAPANSPAWATEFAKPIEYAAKQELQVYMILPARPNAVEYRREQEFAGKLAATGAGLTHQGRNLALRRPAPREIAARNRHPAARRRYHRRRPSSAPTPLAVPGTPEYEIQAQFEFTFLRRNGHWGYPCIVGSGVNATTLHYESNRDTMKAGDLLLMDDAAEFDQYSVDVTRTIPVSGKFSKEQADIYRLVWEAQQAGFAMAKPGHAHRAARRFGAGRRRRKSSNRVSSNWA